MINEENLRGTIVMMHPEMWKENADKQGVIGEILKADLALDDIYVTYGGPQPHLHSADALLVLRPADEILEDLQNLETDLEPQDVQDLSLIARMVNHGSTKHLRSAMELVSNNQNILDYSVISLEEVLGLKKGKTNKR
jgi:hypothetical protein